MALEKPTFSVLLTLQKKLQKPIRILCLGYLDSLLQKKDLAEAGICAEDENFPLAQDAAAVARWHSWKNPVFDTGAVLRRLGFEPVYVDIHPSRGIEQVMDLNTPLPDSMRGAFDIVLDGGTLEHCFNIGQAFMNVAQAVHKGGFVVHNNPMSCFNHGFWNLSAIAYYDFYTQNGFEVLDILGMLGRVGQREVATLIHTGHTQLPPEVSSLVIVRKTREQPLHWPTQGKYLGNKTLKG